MFKGAERKVKIFFFYLPSHYTKIKITVSTEMLLMRQEDKRLGKAKGQTHKINKKQSCYMQVFPFKKKKKQNHAEREV